MNHELPKAIKVKPPHNDTQTHDAKPTIMSRALKALPLASLLILIPKNQFAIVGSIISETIKAANNAKVFVNANGLNSLPSAASIVNTGTKLTMVVATAVTIAELTSAEAL